MTMRTKKTVYIHGAHVPFTYHYDDEDRDQVVGAYYKCNRCGHKIYRHIMVKPSTETEVYRHTMLCSVVKGPS